MAQAGERRLSLRLLVAITACWFLGQMGYYAQAQLFGPVMERYGLDEAAVGLMMSQEVMAYALTALLMAGPVTRFSRAGIALTGAAVVFSCNLLESAKIETRAKYSTALLLACPSTVHRGHSRR